MLFHIVIQDDKLIFVHCKEFFILWPALGCDIRQTLERLLSEGLLDEASEYVNLISRSVNDRLVGCGRGYWCGYIFACTVIFGTGIVFKYLV